MYLSNPVKSANDGYKYSKYLFFSNSIRAGTYPTLALLNFWAG